MMDSYEIGGERGLEKPGADWGEFTKAIDATTTGLKLDSNGLPLVPQPSRFRDDPLVSLLPLGRFSSD